MGEIDEACQVLLVIGKFIYHAKNVMVDTAVLSAQAMNAIYSSKWRGKTSFKRLLNVKGEENGLLFLNVGLEPDSMKNRKLFRAIKNELKEHGIMYAVMPDLCGGDGNTQICVSAKDAKKVEAMLRTHMNGKYKNVYVAEISEFDYTMTGRKADGKPTPEMQAIKESAARKNSGRNRRRDVPNEPTDTGKIIRIPQKEAAQVITAHDVTHAMGRGSYTWMKEKPLLSKEIEGKVYHLMTMPDGKSGIIVPDRDFRDPSYKSGSGTSSAEAYGALVCEHKTYYSVNYEDGKVSKITGEKAVLAARKTPVEEYASRLEKVLSNQKKKTLLESKIVEAAKSRRT